MKSELLETGGRLRMSGTHRRNFNTKDFDRPRVVKIARGRLERMPFQSDGFELGRLRVRESELFIKICTAVNGEKARLQLQRDECLKAIARLSVGTMRTV